jgi:hypothetical protein
MGQLDQVILARLVTHPVEGEGDGEPEFWCGECDRDADVVRVEATYYLTSYTIERMGGMNCAQCKRSLGGVAIRGKYGASDRWLLPPLT